MLNQLIKRLFEFVFFILCITFWVACSRTPKGVISEKKMRNVLVDMHLAEALINMNPQDYNSIEDKKAVYQSVFDKYNIKAAEYDSSLVWYGKNLDLYMRIYNLALTDVKIRIENMGDVKPEAAPASNQDSVDIWMYPRYYEFSPLAISNTIIFDFKPAREYASGSAFILGFQVCGISPESNLPLNLHLRADQGDTTLLVKNIIKEDGYHEVLIKTLPTKKVKRIYGYLRLDENCQPANYHKIYLDEFRFIKFNYGSAYIERRDSILNKKQEVN